MGSCSSFKQTSFVLQWLQHSAKFPFKSIKPHFVRRRPSPFHQHRTFVRELHVAASGSTLASLATAEACGQGKATLGRLVQSFDYTSMAACVAELRSVWTPAKVEDVVQYSDRGLAVRIRTMSDRAWLYISWHLTTAHIGISFDGPPRDSVAQAYSLGERVNTLLKGLVLTDASLLRPWERTAALTFAVRPGEVPLYTMHVEIMSRYSNVALSDGASGNIVAVGHQVGLKMSSVRHLQLGKPWFPPPPPPGIAPDTVTKEEFQNVLLRTQDVLAIKQITSQLVRSFLGVSPSLARHLCVAAMVSPLEDPNQLAPSSWDALFIRWEQWISIIRNDDFMCSWAPQGEYCMLGWYSNRSDSVLQFIRQYYSRFEGENELVRTRSRLQRGVTASQGRLRKKLASLQSQASDPDVHASTKHYADLLMAHLYLVKPSAASVTVTDWNSGEEVTISLDSTKTPVECAEALYGKARKQRRAVDQVAPLIQKAEEDIAYLQGVEVAIEQLDGEDLGDMPALKEIEEELVSGGFIKPAADAALAGKAASIARKAAKRGKGAKSNSGKAETAGDFRKFTSPSGFQVLIGRNSSQNDTLTMRMAQPNDVWMHARGVPGAHLLLRVPSGKSPADEDLQFAADLAAFYSKSRLEGKTEVTCAKPAHISKPRGAKPGQVLVKQEKVLLGRPGRSVGARLEENE